VVKLVLIIKLCFWSALFGGGAAESYDRCFGAVTWFAHRLARAGLIKPDQAERLIWLLCFGEVTVDKKVMHFY
jgi:hypothetical protein